MTPLSCNIDLEFYLGKNKQLNLEDLNGRRKRIKKSSQVES